MPFISHTQNDIDEMLKIIGVKNIADLFDEIPKNIPQADLSNLPPGLTEGEITRFMLDRAPDYQPGRCFIGAGAYEHHIPAAAWDIATRGEFYTAYTPYQPEASQGTLQLIYEYQTMMCELMVMEVSNASLYDGASALAEAVLMALRINHHAKHILVPDNLNPFYRDVLKTILHDQIVTLVPWKIDTKNGTIDLDQLNQIASNEYAAVIIAQPNFFGCIEEADAIANVCHEKNALLIAVVNPIAMALLKPPGKWGKNGADIVCGEGQPLGVPLSGGGPYFGFLCCRKKDIRQLPGRLVGKTQDNQNRIGYVLTLQAREQHIRRAKATSNICTNQGLLVTAAAIYMRLLGAAGLQRVAKQCYDNAHQLQKMLLNIPGISLVFHSLTFHEFVIRLNQPIDLVYEKFRKHHLQPGLILEKYYPDLKNCLLVCVTETKNREDLKRYVSTLSRT